MCAREHMRADFYGRARHHKGSSAEREEEGMAKKDGVIEVQGEHIERIIEALKAQGFTVNGEPYAKERAEAPAPAQ